MELVSVIRFVLAFAVVIALIGALGWILRRYGAGRIAAGGLRGRIGVVESATIDTKRRLVLVRRDGVEHLLVLGPASETVIETGIAPGGGFAGRLATATSDADTTP